MTDLWFARFSDSRPVPKVKQFIPIPNNMPQTDSRLGWEHRRDKVSAVSSAAAIPHHWALGTEKVGGRVLKVCFILILSSGYGTLGRHGTRQSRPIHKCQHN